VFHPTDTLHLLVYFGYPLSFVLGSFDLNRICIIFCKMDRFIEFFNRHYKKLNF
jgi:hypothetical protein